MSCVMTVLTVFDDGHTASWFYIRPGTATEQRAATIARWTAEGVTFEVDGRTLRRRHRGHGGKGSRRTEGALVGLGHGGYTDEITWEDS